MSFDMGYLKGKDKKRSLQESMAHKGTVNGLAFSNTGMYIHVIFVQKLTLRITLIFKVTN